MPLHGKLFGKIAVGSGLGSGGNSAPAPNNPPVILSFTLDDMSLDTGVEGTFSWTKSGTQTGAVLDPGDGSGNYTLTTESSQAHTYDAEGVYDATLTLTGPGGTSSPATVNDIVVTAASSVEFQEFASLKSIADGEQVVTFGIPFTQALGLSEARRTKIFARVVGGDGTLIPVQTEHFQARVSGELSHCAAHVRLPSSYTARTKVEIGYSDTESQPSAPTWATVTAGGDDFRLLVTTKEPRLHYLALDKMPAGGDRLTITLTQAGGGGTPEVFTEEFNPGFSTRYFLHGWETNLYNVLSERISQASGGRYTTRDKLAAQPKDWKATYPSSRFNGFDKHHAPFSNTAMYHQLGYNFEKISNFGSGSWQKPPYQSAGSTTRWPSGGGPNGCGLYIWTRKGGPIEDYTVEVDIERRGTLLPVASVGTIGTPYKLLNYKNRTETFARGSASEVRVLRGTTSGTTCAYNPDAVSAGTTGTLPVDGIVGPGFIDGEPIYGYVYDNVQEVLGDGIAEVDGAITYQTITSSSGGSAKFVSVAGAASGSGYSGTHVHVMDVTGTFANGDTLTSPYGTCVMNGSPITSDVSFYKNATTTAQSDTLAPINSSVADVEWEFVFDDESESPDSPWYDGHQVHQIVKRGALKRVSDGSSHPHLTAEMLVSFDRNGVVVDRQVILMNTKPNAQARDYWLDMEIFVGGVSQTSGNANWQYLYAGTHESARWSMTRPAAHCDPVDFMRAGLTRGFHRYPDWNNVFDMSGKLLGQNLYAETNFTVPGSASAPLFAMPVQSEINIPFYPPPFSFHKGPGNRPELGDLNTIEYGFWAGDSLLMQPVLEAMADNAMGAQGFEYTLDDATGEDQYNPPNVYHATNWEYHPLVTSVAAHKYSRPREYTSQVQTPVAQLYDIRGRFDPQMSHSCSTGCFSAYLITGAKRYFDLTRAFAWYGGMNGPSGNRMNGFRAGTSPGDPDHRMQFTSGGGPRSFARVARDWCNAAAVSFEGSRQRDVWRRIASDMAYWANTNADNSFLGVWFGNHKIEPTYTTPPWPDISEGNLITGNFLGPPNLEYPGGPPDLGVTIGTFQTLFISLMAFNAQNIGAADFTNFLAKSRWLAEAAADPPHGDWWNAVPGGVSNRSPFRIAQGLVWNAGKQEFLAPNATPLSWNSWAQLRAFVETITDPAQKLVLGVYDDVATWDDDIKPGAAGYSTARMAYGALLAYSIYGADAGLRAACVSQMALIDAQADPDATLTVVGGGTYTYSQIWQQTGVTDPATLTNWT